MHKPLRYVLTYHEDVWLTEAELRAEFAANWRRHGWEPVELGREVAMRHPVAERLLALAQTLPTPNARKYEIACWLRWCAFGAWLQEREEYYACAADYDVANRGLRPEHVEGLLRDAGIVCLGNQHNFMLGAVLLNQHSAMRVPGLLVEIAPLAGSHTESGQPITTDYFALKHLADSERMMAVEPAMELFEPCPGWRPSQLLVHVAAFKTLGATPPVDRCAAFRASCG